MPDELGTVELTEPVDVVAWLRALPVGTVLLDSSCEAWQSGYMESHYASVVAFHCVGDDYAFRIDSAVDMATMAAFRPFRVLWTPGGGA